LEGVEVVGSAANGLEAVELDRSAAPDVVVMDVSMPALDGIEATRRMLAADPRLRVVILTAFATAGTRRCWPEPLATYSRTPSRRSSSVACDRSPPPTCAIHHPPGGR
jgi:CheY-like chemotaxis protein